MREFSKKAKKAAPSVAHVKMPVALYGEYATYANALYRAASRSSATALSEVGRDLGTFSGFIKSTPALKNYLVNPIISRGDKVTDMNQLSSKMNLNNITRGFLAVLAENGRLHQVELIIGKFDELMKAKHGIVEATVKTATVMNDSEKGALSEAVRASYLEKGKKLKLTYVIDKSILGGLQLQIGDKFLDLSVQSQINKISSVLGSTN